MDRRIFIFGRIAMFGLLLITAAFTSANIADNTPASTVALVAERPTVAQADLEY